MSFLQDLGGFINEVNSLSEEIDDVKRDVVSSLVEGAAQISQTLNDTKSQITDVASDATGTIHQVGDDMQQSSQPSDE